MLLLIFVLAQFNPYPAPQPDARQRRAIRETVIARVGEQARGIVEVYGEDAVHALQALSTPIALRLARFYPEGLEKLPDPRRFLQLLASGGNADEPCVWALQHAEKLHDLDSFNAYVAQPLEYVYGLKNLSDGAAQMRANRLAPHQQERVDLDPDRNLRAAAIVVAACLIGVGLVVYWKKKRTV